MATAADVPSVGVTKDCLSGKPIPYVVERGLIMSGDMILGESRHLERGCIHLPGSLSQDLPGARRGSTKVNQKPPVFQCNSLPFDWDRSGCADRWPDGVVPYYINSNVSGSRRALILQAIAHLRTYTGISFVPASGDPDHFVEFIEVNSNLQTGWGAFCGRAFFGRLPPVTVAGVKVRGQSIELYNAEDCWTGPVPWGTIVHEMMHALGFYHEHQRSDRDSFVEVGCADPLDLRWNWNRLEHVAIGPYDFHSIMHYDDDCIRAKVPIPVIENRRCLPAGAPLIVASLGNFCLSDADIAGVREYYFSSDKSAAASTVQSVFSSLLEAADRQATAVEYHHASFNHYFVTAAEPEIWALDSGRFAGWSRTNQTFDVFSVNEPTTAAVCRFFTTSFSPKSSHFYTPFANECDSLKTGSTWQYEGLAFALRMPDSAGNCPADSKPLYRLFNDGIGGAPNHRYTTNGSTRSDMRNQGWVSEGFGALGVVGCVPQ
jgi:hypothetical protein